MFSTDAHIQIPDSDSEFPFRVQNSVSLAHKKGFLNEEYLRFVPSKIFYWTHDNREWVFNYDRPFVNIIINITIGTYLFIYWPVFSDQCDSFGTMNVKTILESECGFGTYAAGRQMLRSVWIHPTHRVKCSADFVVDVILHYNTFPLRCVLRCWEYKALCTKYTFHVIQICNHHQDELILRQLFETL